MENDTPETDERATYCEIYRDEVVAATFARILERDRNTYRVGLVEIRDWIEGMGRDDDGEGSHNIIARINEILLENA